MYDNKMPEGWEPRTVGRRPLVDPVPVLRKVQQAPNTWVVFGTYSHEEVKSLRRSLRKLGALVSTETTRSGRPSLYVKWVDREASIDAEEIEA